MIAPDRNINDDRSYVKSYHYKPHRMIAQIIDQGTCDSTAYADTDIISAQESRICAAAALRRSDRDRHGLQGRFEAAEAKSGKNGGYDICRKGRGGAEKDQGDKHRRIAAIYKDPFSAGVYDFAEREP